MLLFLVIFIWTPPHFWALAVRYRDDYAAANVPMMPVVASLRHTTLEILVYSVRDVGADGLDRPDGALGVGLRRLGHDARGTLHVLRAAPLSTRLEDKADVGEAMRLFHFSITYLTALFVFMAVDVLVRHH